VNGVQDHKSGHWSPDETLGKIVDKAYPKMERSVNMTPKGIIFVVIALLFATFVVQNAQVVEVRFLFWHSEASRALVLLGTFVFGLICGWLGGWIRKKERKPSEEDS
jgi:putative membrane protein